MDIVSIPWEKLDNYKGYIVNVNGVFGVLKDVGTDSVTIMTKRRILKVTCKTSVKVYSKKEGVSDERILNTSNSFGIDLGKMYSIVEGLIPPRIKSKIKGND